MTVSSWIEHLLCPHCRNAGDATLSEISPFNNRFDTIPQGFAVLQDEYGGSFFQCEPCGLPTTH